MPQACEADRERYRSEFGSIDCGPAVERLKRRGYTLTHDWCWIPPVDHTPTGSEIFWICFLMDEWDFGGLVPPKKKE